MDGERLMTAVEGKNLSCTARGGQEHNLTAEAGHGLDDGTGKDGLTRTGGTAEDHHTVRVAVGEERGKHRHGITLLGGGSKMELAEDPECYFVFNHYSFGKIFVPLQR